MLKKNLFVLILVFTLLSFSYSQSYEELYTEYNTYKINKINELLKIEKKFEEEKMWINALGVYFDLLNSGIKELPEEVKNRYETIATLLENGYLPEGFEDEFDRYEKEVKIVGEFYRYFSGYLPYDISIGNLYKININLSEQTVDYNCTMSVENTEKYRVFKELMTKIINEINVADILEDKNIIFPRYAIYDDSEDEVFLRPAFERPVFKFDIVLTDLINGTTFKVSDCTNGFTDERTIEIKGVPRSFVKALTEGSYKLEISDLKYACGYVINKVNKRRYRDDGGCSVWTEEHLDNDYEVRYFSVMPSSERWIDREINDLFLLDNKIEKRLEEMKKIYNKRSEQIKKFVEFVRIERKKVFINKKKIREIIQEYGDKQLFYNGEPYKVFKTDLRYEKFSFTENIQDPLGVEEDIEKMREYFPDDTDDLINKYYESLKLLPNGWFSEEGPTEYYLDYVKKD